MERKRIIGLLIFGLFAVLLISNFVAAQDTVFENIFGGAGGGLSNFLESLQESNAFSKLLLFALIALIVYAIVGRLPFVKDKDYVPGGIAIVVGILATFFLDSTEVETILLSYGALGITLTALIPFFIIIAISKGLNDAGHGHWSKYLYLIFGIVLVIRWFTANPNEIGIFGQVTYPAVLVGLVIISIIEKRLWKWQRKKKTETDIDKYEEMNTKALAKTKSDAKVIDASFEATNK